MIWGKEFTLSIVMHFENIKIVKAKVMKKIDQKREMEREKKKQRRDSTNVSK